MPVPCGFPPWKRSEKTMRFHGNPFPNWKSGKKIRTGRAFPEGRHFHRRIRFVTHGNERSLLPAAFGWKSFSIRRKPSGPSPLLPAFLSSAGALSRPMPVPGRRPVLSSRRHGDLFQTAVPGPSFPGGAPSCPQRGAPVWNGSFRYGGRPVWNGCPPPLFAAVSNSPLRRRSHPFRMPVSNSCPRPFLMPVSNGPFQGVRPGDAWRFQTAVPARRRRPSPWVPAALSVWGGPASRRAVRIPALFGADFDRIRPPPGPFFGPVLAARFVIRPVLGRFWPRFGHFGRLVQKWAGSGPVLVPPPALFWPSHETGGPVRPFWGPALVPFWPCSLSAGGPFYAHWARWG